MEYRRLGKSGLQVSVLSFGSWVTFGSQIDNDVAEKCMVEAYEAGVNFFDNAEVYANGRSEIVMGEILKRLGGSRDSFVVSSKVFWGGDKPNQKGLSRKHVFEACHAALKRLQVDYLDLYYCHRPDANTPIEETVRAMSDLVTQGKVLYWGTSEWSAQEILEAYSVARQYNLVPPTMEQPQYNMFVREKIEKDYLRLYELMGLGTTIWSPLASGVLTGKYLGGKLPEGARLTDPSYAWLREMLLSEQNLGKVEKLAKLAKELGTTLSRLSIAWCAKNPRVSTVILGASRLEQLKENLQSLEALPLLNAEVMERIEAILGNKPALPTLF